MLRGCIVTDYRLCTEQTINARITNRIMELGLILSLDVSLCSGWSRQTAI